MSDGMYSVLELFSVELWQEIFEYFSAENLWYSFRDLNSRINAIIDRTTLHLDFKNQNHYRYFMERIFPSINVGNIRSLKFEEANIIHHFFSKHSLDSFVQLRCLVLDFMHSFNDNSFLFWRQLSSLKHLQFLKIRIWTNCRPDNSIEEKDFLIRSIFNQNVCPSLKSFIISIPGRRAGRSIIPPLIPATKITNIKYLWIDSITFSDLITLLPALQNVRSLRTEEGHCFADKSNQQQYVLTMTKPLLLKCIDLHLKLLDDKTFEHVEYLLKHTPNLKKLFLWGWYQLLDASKWEMLLLGCCPRLMEFELVCTGHIGDDNFDQAIDDFEQQCQTIPFWLERNVTTTDDKDYSGHDYRCDAVVQFNMKTTKPMS